MSAHPVRFDPTSAYAVESALTTTRAMRRRLDPSRPVDPAAVRQAIDVAGHAPSAGAEQPVRWVVVTDESARRRVGDAYRMAYEEFDAERQPPVDPAGAIARVRSSSAHLAETMSEMPVLIVACSSAPQPEQSTGPSAAKFYASVYPAVWSLQIALRAHGLGSCITTIGLRRAREIEEALNLSATWTQCALLPVAHMTGSSVRPAARTSTEEVVRWI